MLLGIRKFIQTKEIWSKDRYIYKHYLFEFESLFSPALLNLAINIRAVDDQIKKDKENYQNLLDEFKPQKIAYSYPEKKELNLREVTNKIIHAKSSYWYDKQIPNIEYFSKALDTQNEFDLLVLEGELNGKTWFVGIDLIKLTEDFYEYAEISCEYCGL